MSCERVYVTPWAPRTLFLNCQDCCMTAPLTSSRASSACPRRISSSVSLRAWIDFCRSRDSLDNEADESEEGNGSGSLSGSDREIRGLPISGSSFSLTSWSITGPALSSWKPSVRSIPRYSTARLEKLSTSFLFCLRLDARSSFWTVVGDRLSFRT